MTPQYLFEKLVERAFIAGYMTGSPQKRHMERCLSRGLEIPEYLLPGRLIMCLSEEERFLLSKLKASDTNHRKEFIY